MPRAAPTASSTSSCRSRIRPPKTCSASPGRLAIWAPSGSLAAQQRKVKLPADAAVDAEIDLNNAGGSFFLRARLNVSLPGIDRDTAQQLVDAAHGICPYSKAVHGNIEVATTLA